LWSQAGGACRCEPAGFWAGKSEDGEVLSSEREFVRGKQELVLIGIGIDEMALTEMLDVCLLSDQELSEGEIVWCDYADPFSPWSLLDEHGH
jgi:hypothetical protein